MEVNAAEFFNKLLDYRNILFLCHRNADLDALGSAYALSRTVGGDVGVIEGCNKITNRMVKQFDIDIKINPDPSGYDMVVVVDTPTSALLNNFSLNRYCVIDHHVTVELAEKAQFSIHKNTDSTSEIVLEVLKVIGAPVLRPSAFLLMAGIITDTGNFKYASSSSFRAIAELSDISGIEYGEVIETLMSVPQDPSMRIAMIKSAQRAVIEHVNDWIIVTSHVGSFGGAASSMLINIGADVAFVASKIDDRVKVSCRARRGAIDAGVNLAKIMEDISRVYNGAGGGHEGAAGMDVTGDPDDVLKSCIDHARKVLV